MHHHTTHRLDSGQPMAHDRAMRVSGRIRSACVVLTLLSGATIVGQIAGEAPVASAAGEFTMSPTTIDFGEVAVGATKQIPITVTNVSSATQAPNFAGGAPFDSTNFGGSQNCAGKTFAPGATCQFTYEFTPNASGPLSTSTTVTIGADNFALSLSGVGVAAFSVTPTALDFGSVATGQSADIEVVITNTSGATQTPNFAGGAPIDPTHFGGSQNCAGKTFAPGDSCAFTYTFEPTADGPWSTTTSIGVGTENYAITLTGVAGNAPTTTAPATTAPVTPTTPGDTAGVLSTLGFSDGSVASDATSSVPNDSLPDEGSDGGSSFPWWVVLAAFVLGVVVAVVIARRAFSRPKAMPDDDEPDAAPWAPP